jgi:hypothetical protein
MTTTGLMVLLGLTAFVSFYFGFSRGFRSACECFLSKDGRIDIPEISWVIDKLRREGRLADQYDPQKRKQPSDGAR